MPFAAIGIGTSLIGGLIGSSGAKSAAATLNAAGNAAANNINTATGGAVGSGFAGIAQANNAVTAGTGAATAAANLGYAQSQNAINNAGVNQAGIYNTNMGALQPYQTAGTYGATQLANTAGTFSFDPNNVQNNPAYQFQLAQGEKAIQNSAASRGMLMSGATMKAMDQYSQGLASTSEQNLYNQALSTYNTNQAGYQTLANLGTNANSQAINAGSTYGSQLTSNAGLGVNSAMGAAGLVSNANMQGAGMNVNTAMQGNEYIGNTTMSGAQLANSYEMAAAQANAAGTMGATNAWTSALNGVGGALMGGSALAAQPTSSTTPGFIPYSSGSTYTPYVGSPTIPTPTGTLAGLLAPQPTPAYIPPSSTGTLPPGY